MKTMSQSEANRANVEFYERFAEYYQRIYACVDANETVRQWNMLLEEHQKACTKRLNLVDVGCGPGWHLSAWAKAGFDVAGIDSSPSMLIAAEKNLSLSTGCQCPVYLCDIRDLAEDVPTNHRGTGPSRVPFDVAVAHFNFLNLFAPGDLPLVFDGVASLVRPGGVWLVDCSIPLTPPPAVRENYEREAGVALQCIGNWNEASKTFRLRWLSLDTDIVEIYWFHCLQVYEECAKSSGWVTESRYEWHPNEPSDPWRSARGDSERLVTVYRRTANDESIERNWGVEDGQAQQSAGMADRET
jgi:SAM-dependent methyltransferase